MAAYAVPDCADGSSEGAGLPILTAPRGYCPRSVRLRSSGGLAVGSRDSLVVKEKAIRPEFAPNEPPGTARENTLPV